MLRREFRDVGVDGDDLDADADAPDEPPEINSEGCALQTHADARRRVPEQRDGEDRPPAEAVCDRREQQSADEESGEGDGDERGLIRQAEEAARFVLKHAVADETGREVGGL